MSTELLSDKDLFARLVAFDTTSMSSSRPITDFLADYLDAAGCHLHEFAYAGGQKVNLAACIGPDAQGGIILSGHVDVVPAGEAEWLSNPFELTEPAGRYVGRGTADMKGFVALAANAVAGLAKQELQRPIVLLLTSDEEVGTVGAQQFVKDWEHEFPLPAEAVVGEPTELRVVRMHKGHLQLRLTITGKPAHSGYPQLGIHAIEPAAELLLALRELRRQIETERVAESGFFPQCPHPVLNIAMIHGGSAINVVPDCCTVDVGVRLLPGQSSEEFVKRFEHHLAEVTELPHNRVHGEVVNNSPPMLCPVEAPVNRQLCEIMGQSDSYGVSFASDAGALQKLGIHSVLWGPGRIEDAHQANEYVEIEQFNRAGQLLAKFLHQRCVDDEPEDTEVRSEK